MKKIAIVLALASIGCVRQKSAEETSPMPQKEVVNGNLTLAIEDVKGKAFTFADGFEKENCYIVADCDCCTSDFIFLENGTCVVEYYCLEANDIFKGSYRVANGKIEITYDALAVAQEENIDDPDTLPDYEPRFTLSTRKIKPQKTMLTGKMCKSELILETDGKQKEFGSKNDISASDYTKRLKEEGIWQLLNP
ncbi:hypothetical protein HUK80_14655 [Flavobacterium sp. MAH-1]|uniref:Lipoprotein n=1 Tax=Flavobacterium agri TaxID=2743471 RepID=A0A7Y9C697_9FLAO|nr:hypothetical protein [Flavobacterium agri]NUY82142.1 hypothetical protein [Flavobacterium agri]NYA72166.1 hypothetical protein [Flavobacterium agri]